MGHEAFIQKIKDRDIRVGVFGLGYVGLPLTGNLISQGYEVVGFDPDEKKIDSLRAGKSYIEAVSDNVVQSWQKRFVGISDIASYPSDERPCDIFISCVPTPLNEHRSPDLKYVRSSAADIGTVLQKQQGVAFVILESTSYPGTTQTDFLPIIAEKTGREIGNGLWAAYAPEREDPGNKRYSTADIPRVVGADDSESLEIAKHFYETLVPSVHCVSSTKAAEASKLCENIFRLINIGLAFELKMIFDRMDIDVWEVIDAAKTKPFGYMAFYPGPHCGGHCINCDPHYLTWKAREYHHPARFIELAGDINDEMPRFVRRKIADALNGFNKSIQNAEILILGGAYKPDVGDLRESGAFPIMEMLENRGAKLTYFDPHCPTIRLRNGSEYTHDAEAMGRLADIDCAVLLTNHSCFDYELLANQLELIVDTRNAFAGITGTAHVLKA